MIAPQGVISFISEEWGGRVSDVCLMESSRLLKGLQEGDVILADREFNIQESASMFHAEVKIPPFTRGKKQLSRMEVDKSRDLSRVRIHVERVIGVLKQKYTILESHVPINFMERLEGEPHSLIDHIVTVCSALCNCCESVVNFN